jgi:enamine deaminase RidA (YjgF/YER057c/UK114 family)
MESFSPRPPTWRPVNAEAVYPTTHAGFDHARLMGGTLTSSGIVGWTRDRELPGNGGFEAQLVQALRNADAVCRTAGTELAAAAHLRIYVVGGAGRARPVVHRVMNSLLTRPFPPNSLLGIESLAAPELLVEVEFSVLGLA